MANDTISVSGPVDIASDSKQAVATRLKIWDMLATDRIAFVAYHFPWPGLGHLAKAGDGYRFIQAPVNQ